MEIKKINLPFGHKLCPTRENFQQLPKHFFVCVKNIFPTQSAKRHVSLVGKWATAIHQSCWEENDLKAFCVEDTFGTWMGFLWHFSSVRRPRARCCVLYSVRKERGERSLRSRWLFRRDELADESSWRNGAKCAEWSGAAVTRPARAPAGVVKGFSFNYVALLLAWRPLMASLRLPTWPPQSEWDGNRWCSSVFRHSQSFLINNNTSKWIHFRIYFTWNQKRFSAEEECSELTERSRVSNVLAFPAGLHSERVDGPSGAAAAPGSHMMQSTILIMFRGRTRSVIAHRLYLQTHIKTNKASQFAQSSHK